MDLFKNIRTKETADKRYRKLALAFHSDAGGTDEEFVEIKEQYEACLSRIAGKSSKNTTKEPEAQKSEKTTEKTTITNPRSDAKQHQADLNPDQKKDKNTKKQKNSINTLAKRNALQKFVGATRVFAHSIVDITIDYLQENSTKEK